jgi:hypothetical protein
VSRVGQEFIKFSVYIACTRTAFGSGILRDKGKGWNWFTIILNPFRQAGNVHFEQHAFHLMTNHLKALLTNPITD